jgi:nucleoside-diphosphate-sugar epimerase
VHDASVDQRPAGPKPVAGAPPGRYNGGMEFAVAGAGGAIGRELVRVLGAAGHRVRAIDPATHPVLAAGGGAEAWRAILAGCDVVIAVASRWIVRPPVAARYRAPFSAGIGPFPTPAERETLAERSIGPLADAAVDAGLRRFVLVSSAAVHGRPRALPVVEGDPKRPAGEGARAAWELERRVFLRHVDRGLPLAILRPGLVYGPGVRGPILSLLAHLALAGVRGRRLPTVRRGPVLHLVHVVDVARAAAFLGAEGPRPDGSAYFAVDETPLPLEEVVAAAAAGLGLSPPRPRLPYVPRLARLLAALGEAVPAGFLEGAYRRLARRWSGTARRLGLAPLLSLPVPAVLELLGHNHYYDGSRLAGLGFAAAHPSAPEGLASFAAGLVARGELPARRAPVLPSGAPLPGGVTLPPGPTATALS